jgi:hypothetical protein
MRMQRGRPLMPGYGIEEGENGLLEWADVLDRLREERRFTQSSTRWRTVP